MNKILPTLLFVIFGLGLLSLLTKSRTPSLPTAVEPRFSVVASFYPLAEFTQHIVGSDVEVYNLTPPGVEPHEFEPAPQDITRIYQSKLFVYNGIGFEPWIAQFEDDKVGQPLLVNSARNITPLQNDPHIWLSPLLAIQQVQTIRDDLITLDPEKRVTYEQNAEKYIAQLQQLDQEFRTGLARCQRHEVVTSHDTFQYLAREYGLTVLSISGLSPEEEPSAKKLAEVVQFSKQNNVKYIFFETLVSPKLAETIAKETGAQTLVFNPLEGLSTEELTQGKNYLSVQRENLASLKTALDCQ